MKKHRVVLQLADGFYKAAQLVASMRGITVEAYVESMVAWHAPEELRKLK